MTYWITCTVIVLSLIALNGILNGSWKHKIDAVLGVLLFALIFSAFYFFGWKFGISSLIGMYLFSTIITPMMHQIAKMLKKM